MLDKPNLELCPWNREGGNVLIDRNRDYGASLFADSNSIENEDGTFNMVAAVLKCASIAISPRLFTLPVPMLYHALLPHSSIPSFLPFFPIPCILGGCIIPLSVEVYQQVKKKKRRNARGPEHAFWDQ